MSNYSQTTFFTPKDSLPPSNPAKTIFGAAYDVEFGNISTAIASKYDSSSIQAGQVAFGLGSSTLPSITFVGFTGTGWSSDGSGDLIGSTAGVARLTIFANGGVVLAAATGASEGAGTLNATGLFINGVAVVAGSGAGGVSSIAGTASQILASAATGAVTLSLPTNIIIPVGTSGNILTLNTVAATNYGILELFSSPTAAYTLTIVGTDTSDGFGRAKIAVTTTTNGGGSDSQLDFYTNKFGVSLASRLSIAASGAVSIPAPVSSVVALTATAFAGNNAIDAVQTGATGAAIAFNSTGSVTTPGAGEIGFDTNGNLFITNSAGLGTTIGGFTAGSTFNVVTGGSTRIAVATTGAVTLAQPSSGTLLTISAAISSLALQIFTPATGTGQGIQINGAAATQLNALTIVQGVQSSWTLYMVASDNNLRLFNGADRILFAPGGNLTINAPTSGTALTVNGISGNAALFTTDGTAQFELINNGASGIILGAATNHSLNLYTNNTARFSISAAGGLFTTGVTGGDQGIGTINAGGLFVNSGPVYSGIPQNSQSAAYQLVLSDANKHIYHPSADTTARTWTIPANGTVAFPIGTAVTFDNDTSAGIITLAITTDTLVWLPTGATGTRTIAPNGQGTALKVAATRWHLTGTNIT